MNKKIALALIAFLFSANIVFAQEPPKQNVLDVNLHYKNTEVTLNSIDKRLGYLPDYLNQPQNGYSLQIFDQNAKTLYQVKFNFALQTIVEKAPDKEKGGSIQNLPENDKIITIPTNDNARKLIILDPSGKQILEHEFATLVDPNIANRGATPSTNITFIVIGIIFFVIFAFGIFLFIKSRQQSQIQ